MGGCIVRVSGGTGIGNVGTVTYSGGSTSISATGITTTQNNSLVLTAVGQRSQGTLSAQTAGWSLRYNNQGGGAAATSWINSSFPTVGTLTGTVTATSSTSTIYDAVQIEILSVSSLPNISYTSPITNCSASAITIVDISPTITNATANVYPLSDLYVNVVPHKANTNATVNSLGIYELSPAQCTLLVGSVFGNVQANAATVGTTVTALTSALTENIYLPQVNAITNVYSFGNIQVNVESTIANTSISTSIPTPIVNLPVSGVTGTFIISTFLPEIFIDILSPVLAYILNETPTLPTTLPLTGGTLWNNNGVLCVTTPYASEPVVGQLPTTLPSVPYVLWIDNGIIAISVTTNVGLEISPQGLFPVWINNGVLCFDPNFSGSVNYITQCATAISSVGALVTTIDANVTLTSVTCNTSIETLSLPAYTSHGVVSYNSNIITPALPSGLNVGDLMLAVLFENHTAQITCSNPLWIPVLQKGGGALDIFSIYYKTYQVGDVAPTFSYLNNFIAAGTIARVAGGTGIGTVGSISYSGGSTTITVPGITTTQQNSIVLTAVGQRSQGTLSAQTAGWSLRYNNQGGAAAAVSWLDAPFSTAGTFTGTVTATSRTQYYLRRGTTRNFIGFSTT